MVRPRQPALVDTASPSSRLMRSRISPAALLVNVTAITARGLTPTARNRKATRWARTRVLPEPGPASTSTGPLMVVTASVWDGLSPARMSSCINTPTINSLLAAAHLPATACLPVAQAAAPALPLADRNHAGLSQAGSRRSAGCAQQLRHRTQRQPHDRCVAAVPTLDRRESRVLDGIGPGLIQRVAGRDIVPDLVIREIADPHFAAAKTRGRSGTVGPEAAHGRMNVVHASAQGA